MALVKELAGFRWLTWGLAFGATGVWHYTFFTMAQDGVFGALFCASLASGVVGIPAMICAYNDTYRRNWRLQRKIKGHIGAAMQREDRDAGFREAAKKILAEIGSTEHFDDEFLAALVNSKKEEFFPGSPPWVPKS